MSRKVRPLNTRILKKVTNQIKLEKKGKKYCVYRKNSDDEWEEIYASTKFQNALLRKHNAYHNQIYKLGYTARLLERRRKRKK